MSIIANAIYKSDCLLLLERVQSQQITLVYLDPPWYPSNTEAPDPGAFNHHLETLSKVVQQSYRILSESGSVFFHTDPRLGNTTRLVLDQVFGPENFIDEYICPHSTRLANNTLSRHSVVLRYGKTRSYISNPVLRPLTNDETKTKYRHKDKSGRLYTLVDLASRISRSSQQFEWRGFRLPPQHSWRYTEEQLDHLEQDGRIIFPSREGGMPKLKIFTEDHGSIAVGSVWDDIFAMPFSAKERLNYSGQQSLALLERIVQLGSNSGDIVLDPFCGTGTTFIAAQAHARRWIGCDINPDGYALSVKRLEKTFKCRGGADFQIGDENLLSKHDVVSHRYSPVVTNLQEINPLLSLTAMLVRGEGETVEFKAAACWNEFTKTKDSSLVENIVETVAGFMNSKKGGVLLIGVNDAGQVIGLAEDYKAANKRKQNRDAYQLFLQDVLNRSLGADCTSFYEIGFQQIDSKDVCQTKVFPANRPVFYDHELLVRIGNQTCKFKTQEALEYCKRRWPGIAEK